MPKAINTRRLKVGDKVLYTLQDCVGDDLSPMELTVSRIEPAGTLGRRESAGPQITAHVRPGGFSISFDYDSYTYQFVEEPS